MTPQELMQRAAQARAQADINAGLAALPKDSYIQGLNAALVAALQKNQQDQASVASAAGGIYSRAFDQANQAGSNAALVAGGTAPTANANQGLVGAMGANMAGALGGAPTAALARGTIDLKNLEGQRTAIRAKLPSLTDQYLQSAMDEKQKQQALDQNQALAEAQLASLNASRQGSLTVAQQNAATNASRSAAQTRIAQQNANTNARRQADAFTIAQQRLARQGVRAGGLTPQARSRVISSMYSAMQASLKQRSPGSKQLTAYTYHFQVPDPTGGQPIVHVETAANWAAASQAFAHWAQSAGQQVDAHNLLGYFTGKRDPVYTTSPAAPAFSQHDVYERSVAFLRAQGFGMSEAQRIVQQFLPRAVQSTPVMPGPDEGSVGPGAP